MGTTSFIIIATIFDGSTSKSFNCIFSLMPTVFSNSFLIFMFQSPRNVLVQLCVFLLFVAL